MRHTERTIETFRELFDEIAYDWGFDGELAIYEDPDEGYSFSKTAIFKEDDEYYWSYKTQNAKLTQEVWDKFVAFVQLMKETGKVRTVYMDGVDFAHEAGETDCTIYASTKHALSLASCSDACGVVKCKLIFEEWTHPQKEDLGVNDPKDEKAGVRTILGKLEELGHPVKEEEA